MKICRKIVTGFRSVLVFLIMVPSVVAADCRQDQFLFSEAKRLYDSNQNLLSAIHFSQLRASTCEPSLSSRSWLGYSLALGRLQETGEALRAIDLGLQDSRVRKTEKESLQMIKTWLRQEGSTDLTATQQVRWSLWTQRLENSKFKDTLKSSTLDIPQKLKFENLQLQVTNSPTKSLWAAGVGSAVIPGLGQAYVGNWQAAALSFAINALFIGATLEFAEKDLPAAAWASGAVFSITYIGGILSAAQGAHEYNRLMREPFEEELKSSLLPELFLENADVR